MEDFAVSLAVLAVLVAGPLLAWRRLAGPPATRGRAVARVTVVVLVAALASGAAVYELTKSRSFQVAGDLVSRVDTREKAIVLTLDDGPMPGHPEEVLRVLAEHGAKATFFLTGAEAKANPDQLHAIVAAGHELGNHTYTHRRLYFLPASAVADEVERTDADAMVDYVADGARPGSIVLMHVTYDSRAASREALPRILDRLKSSGYRFVTVSELLAMR